MNELRRILSDHRRLAAWILLPLFCLVLFFWNKCGGDFSQLSIQTAENRVLLERYQNCQPEEIMEDLEHRQDTGPKVAIYEQAEHLVRYAAYRSNIQTQAQTMQQSSIFGGDPNSFTYRNILKTAGDFDKLSAENISLGNDRAVRYWLSFRGADWFFAAAVLIMVMSLLEDRAKGLVAIVRTCPSGRERLQIQRMFLLLGSCAVGALLFYGLPLGLSFLLDGGAGDLLRPVQSLPEFRQCTLEITIGGFLIHFLVMKVLCGWVFGMVLWFSLCFLTRAELSWLLTSAILGVEYLLFFWLPDHSLFSPLREINLFSYLFTFDLYTRYTNVNFLGYPVGRYALLTGLMVLLLMLIGIMLVLVIPRRFPFGNRDLLGKWIDLWNRAGDRLRGHLGCYGFELYKHLFLSFGGLFLLVAFLLTQNLICGTLAYMKDDDPLYRQYVMELQGPIGQDTYDYLAQAHAALEQANTDTYAYEAALERLEAELAEAPEGGWLVYEPLFLNCYGEKSLIAQQQNAFLSYLCLILCLSPLFSCEGSGDVRRILRSTSGGRGKLFRSKYGTAVTIAAVIWLRVLCGEWRLSANYMGQTILSAPAVSIGMLRDWPLSVGGTLAAVYLFKFLCMLIPTNFCIAISQRCRGFEKTFLLSALLLLLPSAVWYLTGGELAILTPAVLLADASPLLYGPEHISSFLPWFVLSCLALFLSARNWCRSSS